MIPQIEAPEQDENPFVLPTFKDASDRCTWFVKNARQQRFDVIANTLTAKEAYDSEGFLKFNLSSELIRVAELPPCFYTAAPQLLSRLRFLGMVEGYGVGLPEDEDGRPLGNRPPTVHDPEVERTCALAVFKLRRLFFRDEAVKKQYRADEFIPLETVQAHPKYQKTKKELEQFFSNKTALHQRLMRRFEERIKKNDFNDNVYLQLGARFLNLNVDVLSKETFESDILKNEETRKAFIKFTVDALYNFYHRRLGRDLKGHLEPWEGGKVGIVLKDKSIEGEIPNFCSTPEENLVLAWKMLHAEGEHAPQVVQAEKTEPEQAKSRQDLIDDYSFHLAGIYCESHEHGAACGQGTWIRILDFFNGKYNEKVLWISSKMPDFSQITRKGIETNYSSYVAEALKDKPFQDYLGALYFGNIQVPTAVQQALIGKIKEAFAGLYRQHFNELPENYELTSQDWVRLDRFLYRPIFTETLQSEILKIANPFLTEDKASMLTRIQQTPEVYQPAFQALAGLIKAQDLNLLKQISDEVSSILQNLKDKHPKKQIAKKCEALLKTLNMPLVSFILPFQSRERLKTLLSKAKTSKKKKDKTFQKFLAEMEAVDQQLTEQYKMQSGQNRKPGKQHQTQSQHNLTVDYPKPAPHPLFELMGEQQADVFWKDFVADEEIQKALLKQFPQVPLKGMNNPYTEQRLKCYTFESRPSQQKFDLTPKGLLLEHGECISDKSKWDGSTLLERAADLEYPEWLENVLKQYKNEIKQNLSAYLATPLMLACVTGNLPNVSCLLDLLKQEGIDIHPLVPFEILRGVCEYNEVEVLRLLLQHAPNIDLMMENNEGNTPLHIACISGSAGIVRLLLKTNKVKINQKNKNKRTPLDLACAARRNRLNPKVIQLLLEQRALFNKDTRVDGNNNLLEWACKAGHAEIVKLLYANGINLYNYERHRNPLDIAAEHGKREVIEVLLDVPIAFSLFNSNYNVHARNKMWGNLQNIYQKQQASGRESRYDPDQLRIQRVYALRQALSLWMPGSPLTAETLLSWPPPSPLKGVSPLLPQWAAMLLCSWRDSPLFAPFCLVVVWMYLLAQKQEELSLLRLAPPLIGLLISSPFLSVLFSGALSIGFSLTCYLICEMVCLSRGESFGAGLNLGLDLLLGPERIEKIRLPEGKTFSDYQAWRRAVKRKLPREKASNSDYEKVDELYYRKRPDYVKKLKKKADPFDYKELHEEEGGQYVYLPSHKAGMLYLYTEQPNADEVESDVFCAAKGNSPEFVKKLLKS